MELRIEKQMSIENPVQTLRKLDLNDQKIPPQPKSWLKRLSDFFSSADLNYDQWERIESKRTGHQMRRQEFF